MTTTKLSPAIASRLTGKYRFDDNFYFKKFEMEVSFKDGNLSTTWGALIPVDEGKKQSTKFIQRAFWSDVEFAENSKGEVDTMSFDGHKGVKLKN